MHRRSPAHALARDADVLDDGVEEAIGRDPRWGGKHIGQEPEEPSIVVHAGRPSEATGRASASTAARRVRRA
jgi:hypothetical protein